MASYGGGVGLESGVSGTDILSEFFDFDDDLIMPDKPFTIKKEEGTNQSDLFFATGDDQDDFFMGATPSPSSSSTTSTSSSGANGLRQNIKKPASPTLELAMSMANDFMNIDFSGAADVDVNSLDDDLDFMQDYQQTGIANNPLINVEKEKSKSLNEATFMEGICIHTDLGSPLKSVRRKLEKRFNVDLTDYTFWLQDSSKLDDKSALSEQCIEGTGIVKVQLNIQPYNDDGTKKINIIDVLKVEQTVDSSEDFSSCDESEVDVEEEPPVTVSSTETHFKPATNFLESTDFSQMMLRDKFPSSICDWSRFHTIQWVRWVNRTFKGVRLEEEKWRIEGSEFSTLSKSEFTHRAGSDPGNNLWSHYTYLKDSGIGMVPLDLENITSSNHINFQSIAAKRPYENLSPATKATEAVTQYPKKQRVILGKYEEGKVFINSDDTSNVHRTGNNGTNVQLWRFLLDILTDYRHISIIRWSLGEGCSDGEFVMVEPEGVARLWGQQKGKVNMNYEKLSRALRYYKGGNILDKVHNKKFTYRFVCDLRDIVGYSAFDLQRQVRDQAERSLRC